MALAAPRAKPAHGEFHALLLASIAGMSLLVERAEPVALFIGFELLSIPLYVLCATEMRREHSLESGLKYLIIGSVGSATLLYGLALIYGATGATDFSAIAQRARRAGTARDRPADADRHRAVRRRALLQGLGGAVSPVDARRLRGRADADHGVHGGRDEGRRVRRVPALLRRRADRRAVDWGPALAALATITIIVGNVGALGQSSLKRMLAYSSVAQAGYMLARRRRRDPARACSATVFYLAVYLLMNMAAFAVIVARERETGLRRRRSTRSPASGASARGSRGR